MDKNNVLFPPSHYLEFSLNSCHLMKGLANYIENLHDGFHDIKENYL